MTLLALGQDNQYQQDLLIYTIYVTFMASLQGLYRQGGDNFLLVEYLVEYGCGNCDLSNRCRAATLRH